jgi:hypothetical protein
MDMKKEDLLNLTNTQQIYNNLYYDYEKNFKLVVSSAKSSKKELIKMLQSNTLDIGILITTVFKYSMNLKQIETMKQLLFNLNTAFIKADRSIKVWDVNTWQI